MNQSQAIFQSSLKKAVYLCITGALIFVIGCVISYYHFYRKIVTLHQRKQNFTPYLIFSLFFVISDQNAAPQSTKCHRWTTPVATAPVPKRKF